MSDASPLDPHAPTRFTLRGLFVAVAAAALVLTALSYSLRTAKVEQLSTAPTFRFANGDFARQATELEFALEFDSLVASVRGLNVRLADDEACYEITITGRVKKYLPSLIRAWPWTPDELSKTVCNEIDKRLGGNTGASVVQFGLPLDSR